MAKTKGDAEDLPQYNYRHPGEAETMGEEAKESTDPEADKQFEKDLKAQEKQIKSQRELSRDPDTGLSPNKGMSDPKTQKETDDENTWSGPR